MYEFFNAGADWFKFELSKLANDPGRLASLIQSKVKLQIEPYSKGCG